MLNRSTFRGSLGLAFAVSLVACLGEGEKGECTLDEECGQRGYVCDTVENLCVPDEVDFTRHGPDLEGGDFDTLTIPFFRGSVCALEDVEAGTSIPVSLIPCLHPCMTLERDPPQTYVYHTCSGSNCEGFPLVWMEVSGTGCPADVFGSFAQSECVYDLTADMAFRNIQLPDGTPVTGNFNLEIPYLTNDDIAVITSTPEADRGPVVRERATQTPPIPERRSIVRLTTESPAPPIEGCMGETNCTCREIGFGG